MGYDDGFNNGGYNNGQSPFGDQGGYSPNQGYNNGYDQGGYPNNGYNNGYNNYPSNYNSKSKVAAGLFAIFLGSLGIHKFYLGYTKAGLIMLLVSLFTCGIGAAVMEIIGLVEGIIYLTKSDADFYNTYVRWGKEWF